VVHEDASAPGAAIGESAPEFPTQRGPETGEQEALFELPEQPAPAEDAAPPATSEKPDTPPAPPPPLLPARERAVLDFERKLWKHAGAKEEAIRADLGLTPTNYFQILNALLDDPAALAYNPTLVGALRRRREARQQARQ
jgi:Protein of unknown function (DUF3263)